MDELEKMRRGELYDCSDPAVQASFRTCRQRMERFNRLSVDDEDYPASLSELIPGAAPTATVVPPFRCDHGHMLRIGENTFVNTNCTMLDGGGIDIGAHTLIGPDCKFYTPQHPTDYIERRKPVERGLRIVIGDDCWLGGGVIVCPGVTIGDRTIVAAGSVVVHDLPSDVMAAGNPAKVKRKLG